MAGASAAIAGAVAQARRRVVAHFESQDAITSDRAVPYTPDQRMDRQAFDQMQRNGIILPVGADRWYFDKARYEAQQAAIRRNMKWVALIGLVALGIVLLVSAFKH